MKAFQTDSKEIYASAKCISWEGSKDNCPELREMSP